MAALSELEFQSDHSVYQAPQGYKYSDQFINECPPKIYPLIIVVPPSVFRRFALMYQIENFKLGINKKSGSNFFVDYADELWRMIEYEKREMKWVKKMGTWPRYEPNTPSDPVGEGGVFKIIAPRPQKNIRGSVCYVSHQKHLRKNARQFYNLMSICDQAVAQNHTTEWLFDTGASFSVTGNLANLQGIHGAPPVNVIVANGQTMSSHHCGRAFGDVSVSGVRYIPGAPDLISGGHLARLGCYSTTSEQGVTITKGGMVVGHGRLLENNTYALDFLADTYLGTICVACPWPYGHGAQVAATSSN